MFHANKQASSTHRNVSCCRLPSSCGMLPVKLQPARILEVQSNCACHSLFGECSTRKNRMGNKSNAVHTVWLAAKGSQSKQANYRQDRCCRKHPCKCFCCETERSSSNADKSVLLKRLTAHFCCNIVHMYFATVSVISP